MASSRKRDARSAPTRKPVPPPKPEKTKPKHKRPGRINALRPIFAADKLADGGKLLAECWREINRIYPLLQGVDAERADKLRRLISVHVREVADMLAIAHEVAEGLGADAQAEGGAA